MITRIPPTVEKASTVPASVEISGVQLVEQLWGFWTGFQGIRDSYPTQNHRSCEFLHFLEYTPAAFCRSGIDGGSPGRRAIKMGMRKIYLGFFKVCSKDNAHQPW